MVNLAESDDSSTKYSITTRDFSTIPNEEATRLRTETSDESSTSQTENYTGAQENGLLLFHIYILGLCVCL